MSIFDNDDHRTVIEDSRSYIINMSPVIAVSKMDLCILIGSVIDNVPLWCVISSITIFKQAHCVKSYWLLYWHCYVRFHVSCWAY